MVPWGFLILAFFLGMAATFGILALCRTASDPVPTTLRPMPDGSIRREQDL